MKKTVILLISLMTLSLVGCGSSSASNDTAVVGFDNVGAAEAAAPAAEEVEAMGVAEEQEYYNEEGYVNDEVASASEEVVEVDNTDKVNVSESENTMLVESKIVYTADLNMQTKEYDKSVKAIKTLMKKYGGVIQSESQTDDNYNWYLDEEKTSGTMHGDFSIRIPSKHFEDFVEDINGYGKIISKDINADNISQQYYDNKLKIKSLEKQEARLYEMMDNAVEIKEILDIEQRLTDVDDKLLSLKTEIRYMDTNVAYSTVGIHLDEVVEYTEKAEPIKTDTFADRFITVCRETWIGFLGFCEGLLFLIIRLLPAIIIIGIILIITIPIIKRKDLINKLKNIGSVDKKEKENK